MTELNDLFFKNSLVNYRSNSICWVGTLYSEVGGYNFRREVSRKCEHIDTITSKSKLRDYKSYEFKNNSLIVHTSYPKEQNDSVEKDSYIQLTAIPIPENYTTRANSSEDTTRFKVFSTTDNDTFTLSNLEPDRLYAIQYTYVKQSPFAYAESRRFIIETRSKNMFGQTVKPVNVIVHNLKHEPKHINKSQEKTKMENMSIRPEASIKLDPHFHNYKVGVDLEPFCNQKNGTHIWLDGDRNEFRIPTNDLVELQENQKQCSPNLCYTTSIIVKEKVYSMERQCKNLASELPAPIPIQRDSGVLRSSTPWLILLIYVMYALC